MTHQHQCQPARRKDIPAQRKIRRSWQKHPPIRKIKLVIRLYTRAGLKTSRRMETKGKRKEAQIGKTSPLEA